MTMTSSSAAGTVTARVFAKSRAEKSSPMVNIMNTIPSCPIVAMDASSTRKEPPQECLLMTTPARR